jgi:hypothetical protein
MAISPPPPRLGVHAWPMDRVPDPEVPERPTRRRFSAAYAAAILEELDRATEPGAKGAILRREGLHSSHATDWRRLRARMVGADGPSEDGCTRDRPTVSTPQSPPGCANCGAVADAITCQGRDRQR